MNKKNKSGSVPIYSTHTLYYTCYIDFTAEGHAALVLGFIGAILIETGRNVGQMIFQIDARIVH